MKSFNQRWLSVSYSLLSAATLLTSAPAVELVPDDASIAGSLGAWFRDAANTFDTGTGIWADSSGNDRHAIPVGEVNIAGHFNLGSDPSIRKDNGQLGSGAYSQAFPDRTTFIRSARMSSAPDAIDEWFNLDGTLQKVLGLSGSSYTTSTDNFFPGDLRAGAEGTPGVGGGNPAIADFDIAQTIVYNSAMTDQQIADVNEWLTNNPGGGSGGVGPGLSFTQLALAEDTASVSLTWRSKPGKKYAVDLSYDLQEGNWQELNDEVDSGGTETTTSVATFSGVDPPDPLRDRVFYQVRELPAQ